MPMHYLRRWNSLGKLPLITMLMQACVVILLALSIVVVIRVITVHLALKKDAGSIMVAVATNFSVVNHTDVILIAAPIIIIMEAKFYQVKSRHTLQIYPQSMIILVLY
jgi:hypothetical protein